MLYVIQLWLNREWFLYFGETWTLFDSFRIIVQMFDYKA